MLKEKEHSFLQHAATFWYRYLNEVIPSQGLVDNVVEFLRSQAFWNCVAVQTMIAPHLFALFTYTGRGYNMQRTRPQQEKIMAKVACAIPLPDWLEEDQYGSEGVRIMECFHKFVMEWHPVLNTHMSAIDKCIMDLEGLMNMPGRMIWQTQRVKLFTLATSRPPAKAFPISVVPLSLESKGIRVRTVERRQCPKVYFLRTRRLSDTPNLGYEVVDEGPIYDIVAPISADAYVFSTCQDLDHESWLVSTDSLEAQKTRVNPEDGSFGVAAEEIYTPKHSTRDWKSICGTKSAGSCGYSAVAFHCRRKESVQGEETSSEYESGYDSMASSNIGSDSESSFESDDDISLSISLTQDCMFILLNDRPLERYYWKSTMNVETPCSFHPTEWLAIWSPYPHKLLIRDLRSSAVRSSILPEPPSVPFSAAIALRKEFFFSGSGENLYYLLYTATKTETGIRHNLSLSSFSFKVSDLEEEEEEEEKEEGGVIFESISPVKTVSYECTASIQHPYVLTHWDTDWVYAAVTPSSCSPKIVRFHIQGLDTNPQISNLGIQTLREPIFFPHSAPHRTPQLNIFPRHPQQQILTLALNAEFVSGTETGDEDNEIRKPPLVMTWDLDEMKDWRNWQAELDERDKLVGDSESTYAKLRGSFVDPSRRFEVPVRSGLDWRKKAFLSCA